MIWLGVVMLSLTTGLLAPWRLTLVVWPGVAAVLGVVAVEREPAGYDMPGLGYAVGFTTAAVALAAWLLGRWVRVVAIERGW